MISPFTCETKIEFDQLVVTGLYTTKELQHRTSYHAVGMMQCWTVVSLTAVFTPFSLSGHRQMSLGDSQCNSYAGCAFLCQLEDNGSGDNINHSNTWVPCMLSNSPSQNKYQLKMCWSSSSGTCWTNVQPTGKGEMKPAS